MATLDETSPLLSLSCEPLLLGRRHCYGRESFETGFPLVVAEDIEFHTMTIQELKASETKSERTTACLSPCQWVERHCAVPFTLLMSAIGAGTLAVPYTFVLLSPIQAILVLCCVGLAMGFTADTLLETHVSVAMESKDIPQENRETYQHLAWRAGGKVLARVTGTLTAFAVFGACVGCVCVVKDMAPIMLSAVIAGFDHQPLEMQQHAVVVTVWIVGLVVALPLGCLTKMSALRFSSYFGVAFSVYLVGAVAYRAIVAGNEAESIALPASVLETQAPLFWRISEVAGMYNFTFMLHLNVIPLLAQLVAAEKTRRHKVYGSDFEALASAEAPAVVDILQGARHTLRRYLMLIVCTCVLLYAIFGVCAAQIYGNTTQGNILLNLTNDQIMAVPRMAVLLTILFSFPLLFHPLRSLVLEMIMVCTSHRADKMLDKEVKQDQELSPTVQAAVTVLLLTAQILCALRVPGIQVVFSFVGSSILLILCYLFPLIFYVQLVPWRSSRTGTIRLVLLSALAVVAIVVCVAATLQLALA
ncbi:unnamed protein product [Peronospora belbahrii]|uniref:Amino acid transporter transmembrane domain-containing protein n=1 Tax=Peronospora belbahrii TaxID=622444 RepID=A0AAU9L861_9STRA|nr:unnamed protein product [Peronospora belbahrii]CAH0518817.1 unnamed protein product [Peronospora belbahrii]